MLLFVIAVFSVSVLLLAPLSGNFSNTVFDKKEYEAKSHTTQNNEDKIVFIPVPNPPENKEGEIIENVVPAERQEITYSEPEPMDIVLNVLEQQEAENTQPETINLYNFPAISFDEINILAREALVNILCTAGTTSISPISASGVLIHHSGIILTNAHVGQYLLLEQDPRIAISCEIRTGSPAKSTYDAELVYLPPTWVNEHALQISELRPLGTGEHDWAILRITRRIDGGPLPTAFPFLPLEIREAAGFTEDPVLLASYPAGFIDGNTVQNNLYAASTITNIKKLYTFLDGSVDLLSLGGVIVAQGGSSGGAVMNAWNHLIGIIVTSSDAENTSERDLRAITIAHVDRSIRNQVGIGLLEFISSDINAKASDFRLNIAPGLIEQFIPFLQEV